MALSFLSDRMDPPIEAYSETPFTVSELDNHPQRGKLWATILEIRKDHLSRLSDAESSEIDDLAKEHEEHLEELRGEIIDLTGEVASLEAEIDHREAELSLYRKAA